MAKSLETVQHDESPSINTPDLMAAAELLADAKRARERLCWAAIQNILKEFGCRLEPIVIIRPKGYESAINCTAEGG